MLKRQREPGGKSARVAFAFSTFTEPSGSNVNSTVSPVPSDRKRPVSPDAAQAWPAPRDAAQARAA